MAQTNIKACFHAVFLIALTFICACKSDVSSNDPFLDDHHSPDFKWGYINTTGTLVIENKYDDLRDFHNGLAAANFKGKWGYIDTNGNTQIEFKYKEAHPFDGQHMIVKQFDDSWAVIDKTGKSTFEMFADRMYAPNENILRFEKDGRYAFINLQGDSISNYNFEKAYDFKRNYALCKENGNYSLISNTGENIKLDADKVYPFLNGYYRYKKEKKYGFLKANGEVAIPATYNFASDVVDEMSYIEQAGSSKIIGVRNQNVRLLENANYSYHSPGYYLKLGESEHELYSFDGNQIGNDSYEMFYAPTEGMTAVMKDDLWSFLNEQGDLVAPLNYPLVWAYNEGLGRYIEPEMGIGFLNKSGEVAVKPYFFEVKDFQEGLARVQVYR